MKKLLLLLVFSSMASIAANAANGEDLFHLLASYNVPAAQEEYDNWLPDTPGDRFLKKTASAYIDLLRGDFRESSKKMVKIMGQLEAANDISPKVAVYADRTVGLMHFLTGNLDSAYQYYWPSLLLSREAYGVNSVIYFDQLNLVIQLFETQGKWAVAEEMLIAQLGYSKKIYGKRSPQSIETTAHLGYLNTLMAKFDVAQGYFDECNKLIEESQIDGTLSNAWSLIYQANFYLIKGNFTVAEALNKQGLKIIEQLPTGYHPAKTLSDFQEAKVYIAMNDLREAGIKLGDLIAYQRKHLGENHPSFTASLLVFTDVLLMSGNLHESRPVLSKCEELIQKSTGNAHTSYGEFLILKAQSLASSDSNEANELFKQAISLLETRYGKNHHYLARALSAYAKYLYEKDDLKQALVSEQRALEIRTSLFDFYHPDYAASIFSLAKIHLKANNRNEAANYLKKGAENYVIQYNKYFSFLSEYEKGQFYARTNEFFDLYYYFALFESPLDQRQYWVNQVFNYRLLTKALLFQSVKDLKKAVYQLNDPQLTQAYQLWIRTKESLSKLNKLDQRFAQNGKLQKDSLSQLANDLEKRISLKVAISKNAQKENNQLNWQKLSDYLDDEEMAIEMIRLRDFDVKAGMFSDSIRYVGLALNNQMTTGPKAVVLMDGNAMEEKHLVTYRNLIKFKVDDKRSYDIYIQPMLDQLQGQMRPEIYFSPDGVYNQINLNTLLNTDSDTYFIDEYHLHILSSLRDLVEINTANQQGKSQNKFVFYGYPVYEHHPIKGEAEKAQVLTPTESNGERGIHFQVRNMISRGAEITMLPGTLAEVETASDIVDDHVDHEMITGVDATETSIKNLKSPGLVHIATHGFFLPGDAVESKPQISEDYTNIIMSNANINPLFNSGLMLTGAAHAYDSLVIQKELDASKKGEAYEDGIMTSYEAMNIDLRNTQLVLLSACETGLGKVKSGEGVYGLQRAFQTAGAQAVVISLWKVSDEATKELMSLFYEKYIGGLDAEDAFTQAQQEMRATFKAPYYWGAFVFVGKPPENAGPMVN